MNDKKALTRRTELQEKLTTLRDKKEKQEAAAQDRLSKTEDEIYNTKGQIDSNEKRLHLNNKELQQWLAQFPDTALCFIDQFDWNGESETTEMKEEHLQAITTYCEPTWIIISPDANHHACHGDDTKPYASGEEPEEEDDPEGDKLLRELGVGKYPKNMIEHP